MMVRSWSLWKGLHQGKSRWLKQPKRWFKQTYGDLMHNLDWGLNQHQCRVNQPDIWI
jgi:hypothetical protein